MNGQAFGEQYLTYGAMLEFYYELAFRLSLKSNAVGANPILRPAGLAKKPGTEACF